MGFFPVDEETLRLPAPDRPHRASWSTWSSATARSRACSARDDTPEPDVHRDAASWTWARSSRAWPGPKRPQDRVALADVQAVVPQGAAGARCTSAALRAGRAPSEGAHGRVTTASRPTIGHGAVVIAAITSCTNTSNPSVMIGRRAAGEEGGRDGPDGASRWVKTSLAPGSPGGHRLPATRPGLTPYLDAARLPHGRLRLHDLHRQPRPAARADRRGRRRAATWSPRRCCRGNRNFEGRINPHVQGQLPGQPAAGGGLRAGRHGRHRPDDRAARARTTTASRSTCATSGRPRRRSRDAIAACVDAGDVPQAVRQRLRRQRAVERDPGRAAASCIAWDADQHLHPGAAVLRRPAGRARPIQPIRGARVLAMLGDSVTTDHISPGRLDQAGQPGRASTCIEHGVQPVDFNSYGAPARQRPRDDPRHVRQHPPAATCWPPAPRAA